jgi:hypothetical protein
MPTFPLDILVEKSGLTEAEIQTRFSVPVDWRENKKTKAIVFNGLLKGLGFTGKHNEHLSGYTPGEQLSGVNCTRRKTNRRHS